MEFTGEYIIPASAETVWAGLNDPDVLRACIPGCDRIDKTSPTEFVATATLKIGPVKATFKGKVTLTEMDPPRRCVMNGEGQGGVAGFAKGGAEVLLEPVAAGTRLNYKATANVGGKLAQIGQRLIDGAARQIADDFFARFAEKVSAPPGAVLAEAGPDDIEAVAPATPLTVVTREGLGPEIWVVGLVAVIVILLVLFGTVLQSS
jgi:carbon monoxide dehydrogenase subunit G